MTILTVYNTSKEIEESKVDTAILPIGSIEQHGPHLPLGTDWIIVQEIAKRLAEKIGDCYLLPAIPYSNSQEHLGFSGTISLKPSTLAQMIRDIVAVTLSSQHKKNHNNFRSRWKLDNQAYNKGAEPRISRPEDYTQRTNGGETSRHTCR